MPCAGNNGWRAGRVGGSWAPVSLPDRLGGLQESTEPPGWSGVLCGNASWQIVRVNRELWSCAVSPSGRAQVPQGGSQGVTCAHQLCSAPVGISGMEKCASGTLPHELG